MAGFLLSAALFLTTPALPADIVFRYVDEHGTPSYTDSWDRIPEPARSRAQALDAKTLEPVQPGSEAPPQPSADPPLPAAPPPTDRTEPQSPSLLAAWTARVARVTIPLPTEYELGVGLISLVLFAGGIMILRMTANALVKLLVKLGLVLVAGGTVYVLYFSGLNERITEATGKPTHRSVTGQELIGDVQTTTGKVADQLKHATVDRLKDVVDQAKDATVGEATRTAEQANEANRHLTEQLDRIEPPRPDAAPVSPQPR